MSERYKQVLVKLDTPLKEAIKQMDKAALQVLIVVDNENKLLVIVTDGDVRIAILNGIYLKAQNKFPLTRFQKDYKEHLSALSEEKNCTLKKKLRKFLKF